MIGSSLYTEDSKFFPAFLRISVIIIFINSFESANQSPPLFDFRKYYIKFSEIFNSFPNICAFLFQKSTPQICGAKISRNLFRLLYRQVNAWEHSARRFHLYNRLCFRFRVSRSVLPFLSAFQEREQGLLNIYQGQY